MAEGKKGLWKKVPAYLGALILCVILSALVYGACVLLKPDAGNAPAAKVPVERVQSGDYTDLTLMAYAFGAPVPAFPGVSGKGETRNGEYAGQAVRRMDVRYDNGAVVRAVTPEDAAPLIRDEKALPVLRTDVTAAGIACSLAKRGDDLIAYFTLEGTAYAVSVPDTTESAFIELLSTLEIH